MKKYVILRLKMAVLSVAVASISVANPISERQALSVASRIMTGKSLTPVAMHRANRAPGQATAQAFYVFNAQANQGYVIVAGDDRVPAVLGYSDNGTFDPADVPPAMQELLDSYAAQIEALPESTQAPQHVSRTPIAPLLTSIWGQSEPFNYYLPFTRTTTNNNGVTRAWHAKTGCVATAMAQVMYYHKYPDQTSVAIPAYTSVGEDNLTIERPELPTTTFDWSAMKDAYNSMDSANASGQAVAHLMVYCDQALQMRLSEATSSAKTSMIPGVLSFFFDYSPNMRYVTRDSYTTTEWENLLYSELAAKRPVVYRGTKNPGGHAFVCDGCDANGLFHINWGWNSLSNGYFLLRDLNPQAQGVGSASGNCGYIYDQGMVIGIKPPVEEDLVTSVRYGNMGCTTHMDLKRNSNEEDFKYYITGRFYNSTAHEEAFDYGWGLFQGETMTAVVNKQSQTDKIEPDEYIPQDVDIYFGKGLANGTYQLRPIFSETGKEQWKQCEGASVNYVVVVIDGLNATVDAHGLMGNHSYIANSMELTGTMHTNKSVKAVANITNKGNSMGDIIYLFVNGTKTASALSDLEYNQSGDLTFIFTPKMGGNLSISLSVNEDGSAPMIYKSIYVSDMAHAQLESTHEVLNVTDQETHIVTGNNFSVKSTIKNTYSEEYDEEVTMRLFRVSDGEHAGTSVQNVTLPVKIAVGETKTVQFDFDNLVNGERYFARFFYYSNGEMVRSTATATYKVVFAGGDKPTKGDINGDGKVDISDVNIIIDVMLGKNQDASTKAKADVTGDGKVDIADVNAVIDIMLGK